MGNFIEFKDISKAYVGVQALKDISFRVDCGQVCAIVGENGAGKSTLLKILSGSLYADTGSIIFDGEDLSLKSPVDAIKKGISVIYQENQLVNDLSVTENIFMESLPTNNIGIINFDVANKEAQSIIDIFELPIKATNKIKDLSVAYQKMVEIMKSYRRNSQIIAFDEPTASLTDSEIEKLFEIIGYLRDKGRIIIYVSHRLKELFQISDFVVVLKDGEFVKKVDTKETTQDQLIKYMVGRDLGDVFKNLKRNDKIGEVVLEVKNLNNQYIHDVNFKLHRGEVIGFAGLVGSGRTEVMRAIFGVDRLNSGEIFLAGKKVSINSPKDAIDFGIGFCPEDRKEEGLVLVRSVRDNITIPILNRVSRYGVLNTKKEEIIANEVVDKFEIKIPSIEKIVRELSGGNQQKVVVGRWVSSEPKVLILDEGTRGIDVGVKAEIYQIICDLAAEGIGVIFISSELIEVINVCDKIFVMKEGEITGVLQREEATEEKVLSLAMVKK